MIGCENAAVKQRVTTPCIARTHRQMLDSLQPLHQELLQSSSEKGGKGSGVEGEGGKSPRVVHGRPQNLPRCFKVLIFRFAYAKSWL